MRSKPQPGASFEEAVVRAANLGDDADTTAAVFMALADGYCGYEAIPPTWREFLDWGWLTSVYSFWT